MRETQSVGSCRVSIQKLKTSWQSVETMKHLRDVFLTKRTFKRNRILFLESISLFTKWDIKCIWVFFLDGNPFHCWCGWCLIWVCCPLLVPVCRPYSSVAVETLCGAATMFLPSAKVTRMSNNNWHAHRVYAEQVAVESTDVVWWCDCLSQILRGFVLLASVLSAVAT